MSYNTLLTAENLEQLRLHSAETQKVLASQIPGLVDIQDIIPALLNQNCELGQNINVLPSPETESLISSPSVSNQDDELDLLALQASVNKQEQLLRGVPVANPINELDQATLMTILANSQLQSNLSVCDPLINVNDENALLNYSAMMPMKNQSPMVEPLDLISGLNELPVEALGQLLNQPANIEIPSLVPSTVETTVGTEMYDPLLIGATNPFLMNELLESNAMIPVNGIQTPSLEQVSTPPQSPVSIEDISAKPFPYLPSSTPVDLADMSYLGTAVTTPSTQPVILESMTPTVPTQKAVPVIPTQIPSPQLFTPELETKKAQTVLTKTNYTYMPVSKKRSNSDLKGAKLERKSSAKASQKKSVPMIKDKTGKTIQKQQMKHTFVIETPGINYGKKTSGRKRKSKNNEEDNIINIPQVPCRPNVSAITPQKLSKIHARTTEDLGSLPYQCEFCPSAFSRKHDLKRHIKIHTGSTPAHKCKHCGKAYARVEALTKHESAMECQK